MYYNDGLKKAEVRNLSGAIISLKKSLKFNKYNIDARNLLGLVYYEMGEVVDALSEWVISKSYQQDDNVAGRYLDAIRQNRAQLDAINQTIKKYNQALLYCKQDSRDLAIIQLKKVLSLNPKLVKAHQLLALLYLQEDKLELAKKTLRDAGKIDANNTTTLRYLKEANIRLKEKNKNKKQKKEDDILSYQSGNETIIMPTRFQDSSLGSTLAYLVIGLIVGALVIGFLVVPAVQKKARQEANEKLVDANDTLTASAQTIATLQAEIDDLEEELKELSGQGDGAPAQTVVYESLLNAYVAYMSNDYLTAGENLDGLDTSLLSDSSKEIYDTVWEAVSEYYYESLYNLGYNSYAQEDYPMAIEYMLKVVNYDKDFKDGFAVYYLAQAYTKDEDSASAREYYEYIVENYPNTERAITAQKYLDGE